MDQQENKAGQNNESFYFMRETIKERPVNRRKLFRRTMITAFSAVVFGMVACFTFLILEPVISNKLYPEEITKVEFPEEEEEILPESMLTENDLQEELEANILQQIDTASTGEISVEEYGTIYENLYGLVSKAETFMTTVTGVSQNSNWLLETFENENSVSGVIVADNGVEYLVLAEANKLSEASEYHVTFQNGATKAAELKAEDYQTGLGIFGVKYSGMSPEEKEGITIAQLGISNKSTILGRPVIAIGSPLGQSGSLSYGMVTATGNTLNVADGLYKILDTDMYGSEDASGVFINLSGEVLGVITSQSMELRQGEILSAIAISELKGSIEKLSNGETLAYGGIFGMDVTREAHENGGMPYGAYVTEVAMQSPAMEAGILNNDVIVRVETTDISSFQEYKNMVLSKAPGDTIRLSIKRYSGGEYIDMGVDMTLKEGEK
ncbi:MAG: serine protease [Lachnospiraceae bacterium]|nr:serine protease [Lachnospiraceae bacterium]